MSTLTKLALGMMGALRPKPVTGTLDKIDRAAAAGQARRTPADGSARPAPVIA